MKYGFKIAGFVLFCWMGLTASSQVEKGLIPWSNKLLINPSYAGYNKNSHFWNSLQFNAQPENKLNNTWTFTYDTWLEKMEGGLALKFHQDLTGQLNTNTIGAGFYFSKPLEAGRNGQLIPSVGVSILTASKQWFVHLTDRTIDKSLEHQSPPGEEFIRYSGIQPTVGLLWNSASVEMGLTGTYSFYQNYGEEEMPEQPSFHVVLHAVKKISGYKRGLISQPVKTSPELTVIYAENLILSQVGFRVERTSYQFGVFAQNNFNDNIHGIGGAIGWKINNLRLNISSGGSYSIPAKKTGFFGEANIGLILPYLNINEINPWAPPPRSF